MKCFAVSVISLVVLIHVVRADDDGFEDDLTLDERQTLRRNKKIYRSNRRGRGRNGEVERDVKVLVKRDESLQRRMDDVEDDSQSDVAKRERGLGWWKGSRVLNSGQEEVLLKRLIDDLEKSAFEKREQGWTSRNKKSNRAGEELEKRMDEAQGEEESEVEKREQNWASKNTRLNRGEELKKRMDEIQGEEEVEKREQGWASKNQRLNRGEELEKRMDEAEDEEESEVEKREQSWASRNEKLNRGEQLEKRMEETQQVRELEKRQLNKPNRGFRRFGQARL
ncbi:hypothetical protein ACHWQZ_G000622 [Mnemiopsis leidyi]